MKKKIVSYVLSIILIITTAFSSLVYAREEKVTFEKNFEYLINELTELTHEDRTNMEIILVPLLITDTGLDTLKKTVDTYTPESESVFHVMLRKVLTKVEKEELKGALSYLYMIDEKVREDYIGGLYNRKELEVSAEVEAEMKNLMESSFLKIPKLREMFEEDGINEKVLARGLKMFVQANGGVALFRRSDDGMVEINQVNSSLKERIDSVILRDGLEYAGADELLQKVCEYINLSLSDDLYKNSFFVIGRELGLVKKSYTIVTQTGGDGGNVPSKVVVSDYSDNDGESGILIQIKDENKLISEGILEKTKIFFELERDVYIIAPNGEKFKNFIREGKEYTLCITELGKYRFIDSSKSYFDDVDGWGKAFIDDLYERGIVSGFGGGGFLPNNNITREEFVKLMVEMFSLKGDFGETFSDNSKEAWYYEYLSAAKHYKIADGFVDGSFGVGKNITRQDMCKILYSTVKQMDINLGKEVNIGLFNDCSEIADYALVSVLELKRYGIVSGDENGNFNPKNFATRQEAAKLIYNILSCYVKN